MRVFYHRTMARFYMKWNKKGFQKHVRKLVDRLSVNMYHIITKAPPEIIVDTKIMKARVVITKSIWYDIGIDVHKFLDLIKEEDKQYENTQ